MGSADPWSWNSSEPESVPVLVSLAMPPKLARSASSVTIQPPFVTLTVHGVTTGIGSVRSGEAFRKYAVHLWPVEVNLQQDASETAIGERT
jgi:hypothetical protein